MSKILVTGGTSPLIAPLVRRLADSGYEVVVLSRRRAAPSRLADVKYQRVCGNICDADAVGAAMVGCTSVIHAAYAPVSASDAEVTDTALTGMTNVLRVGQRWGVREMMLVSSPWAEDSNCYGRGKLTSEAMVLAWRKSGGLDRLVIPRVYNVYGPDMGDTHVIPQLIRRMRTLSSGDSLSLRNADAVRAFIYVTDCAAQLHKLVGTDLGRCDVGDPDTAMTMSDLASALATAYGKDIKVVPEDPDGSPLVRLPCPPRALMALPRTKFRHGLDRTVAWYRERMVSDG